MLHRKEIVLNRLNNKGFSLLEVIVALVLVAIVGAMLFSFMGEKITKSGRAVNWMADELELSEVMEKILADYREALENENQATFISGIEDSYTSDTIDVLVANIVFQPDNYTEEVEPEPVSTIWKVTLTKGNQELITIFTE